MCFDCVIRLKLIKNNTPFTFRAIVCRVLDGQSIADATPPDALGAVVDPGRVARPEVVFSGAVDVDLLAAPDGLVALEVVGRRDIKLTQQKVR